MQTHVSGGPTVPVTVEDYIKAIQRIGSGQFTSRATTDGQRFFASHFGAPFFALSKLAPESMSSPDWQLLIISSDHLLGSDAGRWLSLYGRLFRPEGKLNLTICAPQKPRSLRPPKPLLFQPVQSILVKEWRRYLEALDSPPDVLLFYPDNFDDMKLAAEAFRSVAAGRKVLIACQTRMDALIGRSLLGHYGYETSGLENFALSADEPRHHDMGAWWFSSIFPERNEPHSVDYKHVSSLTTAHHHYRVLLNAVGEHQEKEASAAIVALRTEESVDGETVEAVRTSSLTGIDLSTGRGFHAMGAVDEPSFSWDGLTFPADLLQNIPNAEETTSEDDDRLAMMIWIGNALDERANRELKKIASEEDTDSNESDNTRPNGGSTNAPDAHALPGSNHAASVTELIPKVADQNTGSATAALATPSRLSRSAGTIDVLALAARLDSNADGTVTAFDAARAQILSWMSNKGFNGLDPLRSLHRDQADGEVTIETDGQTAWAMRFDDRRSMDQGAIWRVETTLLAEPAPAMSLRLFQVRSSEDAPPPVVSGVPKFVGRIAKDLGLHDAGVPLANFALRFNGEAEGARLSRLLLNAHRAQPVIVISGGIDASADRLADRLAGVAHVVIIDDAISNHLIRTFGRDLSVYGNAVRLYRPGFTSDAGHYEHRVWPRKGPQITKWQASDIFEEACAISIDADDLEDRAPSFRTVRALLAAARLASSERRLANLRKQSESMVSSKDEQISKLKAIRSELESALEEYRAKTDELESTSKDLQAELQAAKRERDSAREEARQLRYQYTRQWLDDDTSETQEPDDSYYPDTWDELEEWVEIYGDDRLVLHQKAAKSARASPFKDIPLAYKAMEYLVRYYIPMRTRSANDTDAYKQSSQALAELGLEESDVGTADEIKRYKQEYERVYEGEVVTLNRHLKRGVGFGGEYQFRLYFYYDADREKVLVGHMPTHLTNRLSHNG